MGLQHRGQGARRSGCYSHSYLYNDTGPRATHADEVQLPRHAGQEGLQHRPLQGNPQVSQPWSVRG